MPLQLQLWHEHRRQTLLITHDIEEALFLASELILLSPGPGEIVEKITLDYGRRFVSGESCRDIKSEPAFIAQREHILRQLYAQREVH
ncbi:MAG: Taurine import ATP-binding protein TauB [Candidatus Erwinia impunctatus]